MKYALLATLLYLAPPAIGAGLSDHAPRPAHGIGLQETALGIILLGCAIVTGGHASQRRAARAVLS